jgi:PAS domain S-box-containing protein
MPTDDGLLVMSAIRDVTDRRRAEGELRQALARLEAAVRASDVGIWDCALSADGALHGQLPVYYSPKFKELLGYAGDEFPDVLASVIEAVPHGERREFLAALTDHLTRGTPYDLEHRAITKSGETRWFAGRGQAVRDEAGRPVRFSGSLIDITERKRVEEALRQNEKLTLLGELLAGVAHELNNPLTILLAQAEYLGAIAPPGRIAERAASLRRTAERCARIVRNFLALARRRPPERQSARLNDIVRDALELVAYQLRLDEVQLDLALADDVPDLWMDPHQLHQVVVNLTTNARQAMRQVQGPRRLGVATSYARARAVVCLEISDSGPGISADVAERIFEPFFTTKRAGEGTGLGLSLSRSIVEGHGGTIRVVNVAGGGAIFRVELPVPATTGTQPAESETAARVPPQRVLVVDDDLDVARTVRDLLVVDGHVVDVVGGGAAALERLRERRYDLVLSDVRMPGLGGLELYDHVRREHPRFEGRFLFLTGDALGATTAALEARALPCLPKPFSLRELRDAIRERVGAITPPEDIR